MVKDRYASNERSTDEQANMGVAEHTRMLFSASIQPDENLPASRDLIGLIDAAAALARHRSQQCDEESKNSQVGASYKDRLRNVVLNRVVEIWTHLRRWAN